MHEPSEPSPENGIPSETLPPERDVDTMPPRQKGFTVIAWLVILCLVGLIVARSFLKAGPAEAAQQERLQEIIFEMQARYIIGAGNFAPTTAKSLYRDAETLDGGSWEQRLKFVVLAGEVAGPQEGLKKAQALQNHLQNAAGNEAPTPRQKQLALLLLNLYQDYDAGDFAADSLSKEERAFLRSELSWFGELALHPAEASKPRAGLAAVAGAAPVIALEQAEPSERRQEILDPALTTFGTMIGALGSVCFVGCGGFVGLVIFVVMLTTRNLHGGLTCGSYHGGVYAETFALFLVSFLGLSFLLPELPRGIPPLVRASLVPLGSLLVVFWPVLRGIPWARVRQDIGWTLGQSPALEPAMGVACYVLALPLVLVGLVLSLVLMALRNQWAGFGFGALAQNQPVHPIVEFIVHGNATDRLLVFFDACILAPIVEETMFRGFLYRHLRELSHRWSWLVSVMVSGTIVSFIFAVIHPQGIIAVPVLMALAYGFTIAREWRGSLIPCMVGHAMNNALVVTFVILVMGG